MLVGDVFFCLAWLASCLVRPEQPWPWTVSGTAHRISNPACLPSLPELQTLGFVMGTVALGLGFALAGGWEAEDSSEWLL